jgi:Ca2+:H+ antiporter
MPASERSTASKTAGRFQKLSLGLAVLLIVGYGLGLLFTLRTDREVFSSAEHAELSCPPFQVAGKQIRGFL